MLKVCDDNNLGGEWWVAMLTDNEAVCGDAGWRWGGMW